MPENENRPALYIDQLHLKGFKSIEDLEVKLNPGLNILIGKNGAGKSNFLEFVDSALTSLRIIEQYFPFKSATLKLNDRNKDFFEIDIVKPSKRNSHDDNDWMIHEFYHQSLKVNNQLVFDSSNENPVGEPFMFHKKKIKLGRTLLRAFPMMGYYFRFVPTYIRFDLPEKLSGIELPTTIQISLLEANDPYWKFETLLPEFLWNVFSDTENSYLTHFDKNSTIEKIWDRIDVPFLLEKLILPESIIDNLIRFSPIKGLRFNENIAIFKDDRFINVENIKLEFLVNERWMPWSQLSDGTKRLFFIITEITHHINGLVLIEEPELGVHPHQFHLLMEFIKEQSSQKQIILSTHSPKALDHLEEDELDKILIAVYDQKKGTQLNHLTPEQIQKAKIYMNKVGYLSDYWLLSDLEE